MFFKKISKNFEKDLQHTPTQVFSCEFAKFSQNTSRRPLLNIDISQMNE